MPCNGMIRLRPGGRAWERWSGEEWLFCCFTRAGLRAVAGAPALPGPESPFERPKISMGYPLDKDEKQAIKDAQPGEG